MPHLVIQHSPGLSRRHDMTALCETLRQVMVAQGCLPVGGIGVRAWPTPAEAIAVGHPDNCNADLGLRMGAGRTPQAIRAAGKALMATAKTVFAIDLARPHFPLALETIEIDPNFSWKANSIQERIERG